MTSCSHTLSRPPRVISEEWEDAMLAPQAQRSTRSRGRQRAQEPCPFRTEYQRDRDRILHSKSFRRLAAKTQVFVPPRTDHDRTRLTHTLEVCQVARTIARALRLNEDLTEAIALGHDLGHSPFGHTGESALDEVYRSYDAQARFLHSEQSLRVVDVLEREGRGLNLTWEVRDGIMHHSKGAANWPCTGQAAATLEGQLVALCDRVAYSSHDIDDALRSSRFTLADLTGQYCRMPGRHPFHTAHRHGQRCHFRQPGAQQITMSPAMTALTNQLKDFMYENLYLSRSMAPKVRTHIQAVIHGLFHYYMAHPDAVPNCSSRGSVTARARAVCDHIAGMTDHFAERLYPPTRATLMTHDHPPPPITAIIPAYQEGSAHRGYRARGARHAGDYARARRGRRLDG